MAKVTNPEGKGGFQKGKSGNPGGRPKVNPQFRLGLEKLEPIALKVLGDGLKSADEKIQVACMKEVFDRLYGRPAQSMEIGGKPDAPPVAVEFIDRPPRETFAEWEARRKKSLEGK